MERTGNVTPESNGNESPSYYVIIPEDVYNDKRLTSSAKLLYGKITALAHKEGYCWATDSYLAQLHGVSRNTVNRWIQNLKDCGYISIGYTYEKNNMSIAYRKISITKNDDRGIIKNGDTPIPKNSNIGIIKNGATPIIKNGGDTITRRNNTSRNTTRVFRADAQTLGNGYSQNNFFQEPALSVSPAINVPLEPAGASLPKPKQAKPNRPKEPPLTEREPKNDQDRVIKAYALNFKTLYEQGKVTTPTPVINYGMIGKLIKHHIADNITVEQLTGALNRAMSDTFVLGRGYTFSTILSAGVLNRLINSKATPKWATTPGRSTPVVGPKKIMLML